MAAHTNITHQHNRLRTKTERKTEGQNETHRQTGRWAGGQTERQSDRHTDRQTVSSIFLISVATTNTTLSTMQIFKSH